jgi:hypothetical protein
MSTQPISEAEARKIMSVLGKAEGEFAASIIAPIYWIIREDDGRIRSRNGTAFFLDAGRGVFGVTAAHVLEGWREDAAKKRVLSLQLSDLRFEPEGRHATIAADTALDLLTFRVTEQEVRTIGKTVLRGYQAEWPPPAPQLDKGLYYAGFPGRETLLLSPREVSFGIATGSGVVSSISDRDVSTLIEREHIMPSGLGAMLPENFDFGGISGGPMLAVIEYKGLRTWALAGVIYQGPNTSSDQEEAIAGFELIRARRAHFILPDGSLDLARWQQHQ